MCLFHLISRKLAVSSPWGDGDWKWPLHCSTGEQSSATLLPLTFPEAKHSQNTYKNPLKILCVFFWLLLFVYNSTSNKNCTIYCIIIIEINGKHSVDSLKSCPALRLLFSSRKHQLSCTFQLNGVWKCVTRQKWKWNNWAFHLILFILNLKHRSRLYKLSST